MKKLQWLKTKVGLFLDPRILYLMNLPNAIRTSFFGSS